MPFEIVRNDITNMQADAIVNTADVFPIVGSGVDSEIHKKAGPQLLEARKKVGIIMVGDAALTPAFDLDAKYVIHTAGPVWENGDNDEDELLASCYRSSLELARDNGCTSIAFPLISTGNFRFPKARALRIAVNEFSRFLFENDMHIYLVVFENESFELSEKLFSSVKSYIDENYVSSKMADEYYPGSRVIQRQQRASKRAQRSAMPQTQNDWDSVLGSLDAGFSETLLHLIDLTGMKDPDIYKKANVDRKLFSKIRNNKNYKPSKTTALAFAFALELDIDKTRDLISRAGYALSHSSKFDIIVEYFLINKNYDIFELNEVLFAFDQPLLGS